MRNNLQYRTTGSGCANIESTTLQSCEVRVVDCDLTDGSLLLTDCDKVYMCNRCQTDPPYYMPWVPGMKFMLQTRIVNTADTNPEQPLNGWGDYITAELLDQNFNVISSGHANIASRWVAGWENESEYQTIEIDTGKAAFNALNCFMIRINALDGQGAIYKQFCTHHFRRLRDCETAITVEGRYQQYDCFGYYYGVPTETASVGNARFRFRNTRHYRANVKDGDDSFEKTIIANRVVKVDHISQYRLVLHDLLPPYAMRMLTRQILPAPDILIDGQPYEVPSFTMNNEATKVNYYFFTVDLERKCENELRCTPAGALEEPPILPPPSTPCVDCIEVSCFG